MLEALLEIVFSLIGELFMDLGWDAVFHAVETKKRRDATTAAIGWFSLGLLMGGISAWIHPAHVFHSEKTRLAILIGAPLLAGVMMHLYGRARRRRRGKVRSSLATFVGGAAFALGIHLVRFFWR
jgi:cytochrome bd-type quinol oxidase subunit 2